MNLPSKKTDLLSTQAMPSGNGAHRDNSRPTTAEDITRRFDALVHTACPEAACIDGACMANILAMLADDEWQCEASVRHQLERMLVHARGGEAGDPRVPQDEPARATAWPRLRHEVDDYVDFVRLRGIEATLHDGASAFHFDRQDWQRSRGAEIALRDHQRHVREASYVPAAAEFFRVH